MIPRLEYAAALVYSPRGTSTGSVKSRRYRDALKRADPEFLQKAAAHVARQHAAGRFPGFFGADVTLIPVPGSAPRRDPTTLWVTERLCHALLSEGLGSRIWMTLRRATPVAKSAHAQWGERPGAQAHVESLVLDDRLPPAGALLLVDDFVTKGRTLLASATVLLGTMPGVTVKGFALIRTMGLQPEIEQIVAPAVGTIRWDGDAVREP